MECSAVSLNDIAGSVTDNSPPMIAEDEGVEFMEIDGFSESEDEQAPPNEIVKNCVPEFDSTQTSKDFLESVAPAEIVKDNESNEDLVSKDVTDLTKTESPTSKRKEIVVPRRSRSRSKSRRKRSRSRSKRRSRSRSRRRSNSRSKWRSGRRRSRSRSRKRSYSRSKKSSRRSNSRSRKRSCSRERSRRKSPVADKYIIATDVSNVIKDDCPNVDTMCVVLDEAAPAVESAALENTETEKLQKELDNLKTSLTKHKSRSKSRERKQSKSQEKSRSMSRDRKQSSKSSTRKRSRFSDKKSKSKSRSKSPEPESKRQRKALSLSAKLLEAKAKVPPKHQRSPLSQRKRHVGDKDCPPPSPCIIVFGLPMSYREAELEEMWFPKYEGVDSSVIVDRLSGISRGFGFVNFSTVEQAESAMKTVAGLMVDGNEITCKFSITKKRHTPTANHYLGDKKTLQYLSKPRKYNGQEFKF